MRPAAAPPIALLGLRTNAVPTLDMRTHGNGQRTRKVGIVTLTRKLSITLFVAGPLLAMSAPALCRAAGVSVEPGAEIDAGLDPEIRAAIEPRIDAIFAPFDSDASPGCAVGVVKDGELVFAKAYGMADLEQGTRLTPDSMIHLASESKHFTAAAVLLAARQGELALDDPVREHVPELPDSASAITLRHLLHHTSGLRDYGVLWALTGEIRPADQTATATLDLLSRQRALNFPPGTDYAYSNSGYFLLGLALERATGLSLPDFAQRYLFGPLGMDSTRFVDDPTAILPGRAEGHVRREDGGFGRIPGDREVVGPRGVASSIRELARWERLFHGKSHAGALAGLSAELLTPGRLDDGRDDGRELDYAAGLVLEDFDGLLTVSHGGDGDGSSSLLLRFPEVPLSVLCACNLSGAGVPGLAWRTAIRFLYGVYAEETAALQTPSEPPVVVEPPADELARWAGTYRDRRTHAVQTVSVAGGNLVLRVGANSERSTGGGGIPLRPLEGGRFLGPEQGPTIEAVFRRDGRRDEMRLAIQGQPPVVWRRIEPIDPEAAPLADYAGEYWSDELLVPWTLDVRNGELRFAGIGAPEEPLEPILPDELLFGTDVRISFERDQTGRVVALHVHTDRVWDLRFERRDDGP